MTSGIRGYLRSAVVGGILGSVGSERPESSASLRRSISRGAHGFVIGSAGFIFEIPIASAPRWG